jgi:hypothetical protein
MAGTACAADCALLTSVKMRPIRGQAYDVRTIPVTINGQTKNFQLDTGGVLSQISQEAANEQHLESLDSGFQMYDVNGNVSRKSVTVEKFLVGQVNLGRVRLPIATAHDHAIDGLLATNMMVNYDIDLDFPRNILSYISPGPCSGADPKAAEGAVPITLLNNRIAVKVTLDGQQLDAFIDTGSTQSIMSDKIAKYFFHVPFGAAGDQPIEKINGDPTLTGYLHTFANLSFGRQTIAHPHILILEDRMSRNGDRTPQIENRALANNARIALPKLVIGMNMLKDLRVYMSFHEHRPYVTHDAAPVPPAR